MVDLTLLLIRFLVHLADLIVRPQGFEVVVAVDVVDAGDELLRELETPISKSLELSKGGAHAYLVNGILQLSQPVSHLCELPCKRVGYC
jgi:hypothetical protein